MKTNKIGAAAPLESLPNVKCPPTGANKKEIEPQQESLSPVGTRQLVVPSSFLWERMLKEQPWAEAEAKVINADDEVLKYILDNGRGFPSEITQIQLCRNIQKLVNQMEDPRMSKNPEHLENKASALKELRESMDHPSYIVNPPREP